MKVNMELRTYGKDGKVWIGKYLNSQNIMHWHYDCELFIVTRGEIEVYCDKKYYTLGEGDAFFINMAKIHSMHALKSDTQVTMIIFDYDIISPFAKNIDLVSPKLSGGYDIEGAYERLKTLFTEKKKLYIHAVALEVAALMLNIFENEPTCPCAKTDKTDEKFKEMLVVIDENYRYFTFNDGAKYMGMSEGYFSRYFHRTAGVMFLHYLNSVKVQKAVELIQSQADLPMYEIADRCGFNTIRSFNRNFKDITGYPPRRLPVDYRAEFADIRALSENKNPTLSDCVLLESFDAGQS